MSQETTEDKLKLTGIFSQGYGIIPKKLMKIQFEQLIPKNGKRKGQNIKLILAYLLSYSGAGAVAFPSIRTIASDLEMSTTTVMEALEHAIQLKLIIKEQKKRENGDFLNNTYHLKFLDPNFNVDYSNMEQGVSENDTGCITECYRGVSENDTGVYHRLIPNNNNIIITYNNNIYNKKEIIKLLTEKWNEKEIFSKHKISTIERQLKKKHFDIIKEHGLEDVIGAINNYNKVLNNPNQFYTHKFNLWRFIEKIDDFLDSSHPENNWLLQDYKKIKEDQKQKEIDEWLQEQK